MKSFIIIEHEPLTVRLKKIWNIDALKEKGIHVEYWDLSQYIFPNTVIPKIVEDSCVKVIKDLHILEMLLSQVDIARTVFALEMHLKWENRALLLLLHRYQCNCVRIDLYANTMLFHSIYERTISILKNFTFKKFIKKIAWFCWLRFYSIRVYEKLLSSSTLVKPDIRINHPDYEEYLSLDEMKPDVDGAYLLFIDNYYPLHPDIKIMCPNTTTDEKSYWELMRNYFDFLEEKFHKKVIIAAHPKAVYSGQEFGKRDIYYGQTAKLIKFADAVVMHGSNSLSYIALADKPFAIVYPNSYKMYPYLYKHIGDLAAYCKKKAYNLECCDWNKIQFEKLDTEWRKLYISTFITSEETSRRKNVDIWIDELLKKIV